MLRPVKRTRLYEDVVAQIEHLIRTRELCPGDRLPSERELAATLGIGRASVREALRTLDSTGLIEVRSGQGAFLSNISLNPYFASIRESLSFLLDVRDDTLLELWEVRRGLEEQIVLLAACRRSEKDIGDLRALTGEMRFLKTSSEEFVRSGIEFHRKLAEMAGNTVLLTLWEAIAGLIEQSQRRIIGIPGQFEEALDKHEALLAAVVAADAGVASQAMREHMDAEGEHLRNALLGSGGQKLSRNGFRKLSSGEISRAEVTKSA